MKKITLSLAALSLLACTTLFAFNSQPKKKKAAKTEAKPKPAKAAEPQATLSPDEMQKIMMEYGTPGEGHEIIKRSAGAWRAETTQWFSPDAEPTKSEGKCVNEMVMDGRYQIGKFSGTMMGMPFEGMNILAFDNAKQEYINTWIDNMGTGIMVMKGKFEKETNTIHFKGTMVDPISKQDMPFREDFIMKDDNTQIMEMYAPTPDGKGEFKTMEIVFRR